MTQRFVVEMSDEDAEALAPTPMQRLMYLHLLVRKEVRRLGGKGVTAVEYEGQREEAVPPGLVRGPFIITKETP